MSDKYKLYILMRNDLPSLTAGKAMAQACHAANQFVYEHGHRKDVKTWQQESEAGFGTTIVLSVDPSNLGWIVSHAPAPAGLVWDTTYPFVVPNQEIANLIDSKKLSDTSILKDNGQVLMFRSEYTCAYVFLKDGSGFQTEHISKLPLHP